MYRILSVQAGAGLAALLVGVGCSSRSPEPPHTVASYKTPRQEKLRPASLNVIIRPYDLLRNSFRYEHKVVQLDCRDLPRFYQDQFIGYLSYGGWDLSGPSTWRGLRFNRMIAPGEAVYDLIGLGSTANWRP